MSAEESWTITTTTGENNSDHHQPDLHKSAGFDSSTGIYKSLHELGEHHRIPTRPDLDTATFVLSQFPSPHEAESRVALIDSATGHQLTYSQLHRSIRSLARGLYHALGVRKGDVVFLLSPNSLLYPTICLAVLSVGAILTTANPLNTASEIAKQVSDSGPKLAISSPEELHKLAPTGVPTIPIFSRSDGSELSIEELIESCESAELDLDLDHEKPAQSDTAAILYSSGTTGTSKGVVLKHSNLISIATLFKWCGDSTRAQRDVFLCFIPMFHIYGLAVFVISLFCSGITTVLMAKFELRAMLDAIKAYGVNNIPAVPPVILALVKHASGAGCDLSSLRRVSSGAAPLSNEIAEEFRRRFPWVELRPGYGLTESGGAATFSVSDREAKLHSASCGRLLPTILGKIVDPETGKPLPPYKEGELWLKSSGSIIMKEYLGKEEETADAIDPLGWLKTGDLCYFDENGFLYIVDRIKELIKHNGYQVLYIYICIYNTF